MESSTIDKLKLEKQQLELEKNKLEHQIKIYKNNFKIEEQKQLWELLNNNSKPEPINYHSTNSNNILTNDNNLLLKENNISSVLTNKIKQNNSNYILIISIIVFFALIYIFIVFR